MLRKSVVFLFTLILTLSAFAQSGGDPLSSLSVPPMTYLYSDYDAALVVTFGSAYTTAVTAHLTVVLSRATDGAHLQKLTYKATLTPGSNVLTLSVPARLVAKALARGCDMLSVTLKAPGHLRAAASGAVAYDSHSCPLAVAFTRAQSTVYADVPMPFAAYGSCGTRPYLYTWDFGDGNTGVGSSVVHAYAADPASQGDSSYTVTLTVQDATGQEVQKTMAVYCLAR